MNRLLRDKKGGWKLIKAESLKLRHTFGKALPVAAPLFTVLAAFLLTGGGRGNALPAGTWNWWYTLLLPGMLAVLCYLGTGKDKKIRDYHLRMLPEDIDRCLIWKIMYYILALTASNFLLFVGALLGGKLFGTTFGAWEGFCGFLLLSIASLWEVPFYLLLSARFGMAATVLGCVVLSLGGVAGLADTDFWWLCPSAVPSRLMCPVLGILPNGLPVPTDSSLRDCKIILPGIVISLLWFMLLSRLVIWQSGRLCMSESGRRRAGRKEKPE